MVVSPEPGAVAYEGSVFRIVEERYSSPSGESALFEFAETRDVVRVYPITRSRGIVLISEARYGVTERSVETVLRTVSGGIEDGETPEEAAFRELREEVGLTGDSATVFHVSRPMLKVRCSVFHVLVEGARYDGAPNREPFEEIRAEEIPLNDVAGMVWRSRFAEDVVAFGLLKLLRLYGETI